MKNESVAADIQKLNALFHDLCSFLMHEPTQVEYVEGETLENAFVDILASDGTVKQWAMPLKDVLTIYLQAHIAAGIEYAQTPEKANEMYWILCQHFTKLGILEFYIPVMITKTNPKHHSSFVQFAIVDVPLSCWDNKICDNVGQLIKNKEFTAVGPTDHEIFMDDALPVLQNYIAVLLRCIFYKTLKYHEVTTRD